MRLPVPVRALTLLAVATGVSACAGHREPHRLQLPLEAADSARLMEWAQRRSAEALVASPSGVREEVRGELVAVTEGGSILALRVDAGAPLRLPAASVERIAFPQSDLVVAARGGLMGAVVGLGVGWLVTCGLVGCSGDDGGFAVEMSALMGGAGILLGFVFGDEDPPQFRFKRDPGSY